MSELLSRLHSAARARVPLVVSMADGSRVAGTIVVAAITFVVVRDADGHEARVELAGIFEVLRRDGRRYWPPRVEARP